MILGQGVNHLLLSMLTLNFKILPKTLVSEIRGSIILSSMLTLTFKIVPKTLVSDTVISASQENCLGAIYWQKYPNLPADSPNLPVSKSASRNTQFCQSGNLPGGRNLPAETCKYASRFTKSASKEICWGESAGRNTQICLFWANFSLKVGRRMITEVFHTKDQ